MSRYTYLVKMMVCVTVDEINAAILSDDPDTPSSAEDIISCSWDSRLRLLQVFWKERKWLE